MCTLIAILMVSYQVRLNTKVSITISSFPGCSNTVDYCTCLPSPTSIDMSFPSITPSLNSSSRAIIEFITITPLLGLTAPRLLYGERIYLSPTTPLLCTSNY